MYSSKSYEGYSTFWLPMLFAVLNEEHHCEPSHVASIITSISESRQLSCQSSSTKKMMSSSGRISSAVTLLMSLKDRTSEDC